MIQNLVDRFHKLENSVVLNLEKLTESLDVNFSINIIELCKSTRFDYIGGFEWLNTDEDTKFSTINMTKVLRKQCNLPANTLILADDGESYVFMKCFGDHEEIYWIDNMDLERFCRGEALQGWNRHFPTFEAFFEFLLDEEERMRKQEESEK